MLASQHWDQFANILCVRPDNMGDVIMCTSAIRALKARTPDRRITLLTSSPGAAISLFIPEVDDTIRFDVPWVKNQTEPDNTALQEIVHRLQAQHFEAAVLFTSYSQSPLPTATLCYLAGIPRVLGYCRENPYRLISDWVPDPEPRTTIRHEVRRQLDLVGAIGAHTSDEALSLHIPVDAYSRSRSALTDAGVQVNRPWLVMHTGASEAKRRYSQDDFVAAGKLLLRAGWQIVLSGSAEEAEEVAHLHRRLGKGSFSLAGKLPLAAFCALIGGTQVLISNNTGPVHIAAALQTAVVVLYAQTNPQHTPWQVPSRVLYFPVPQSLRSKNQFLQDFPGPNEPRATPAAIVQAVHELTSTPR